MARARHGSYLFQRPGSANWHLKLRSGGQRIEQSLGTSDRREAEILALPLVEQHKRALLAARPRFEAAWLLKYTPGLHVDSDGVRIFATERELHYLADDGAIIRCEPNGGPGLRLLNATPNVVEVGLPAGADIGRLPALTIKHQGKVLELERPRAPTKGGDDAILATYLNHAGIEGYDRSEAETVWALYKHIVGKPLKDATRDDARKLVERFKADGNKSATINKKVSWLRSAVNLAIGEGKLKFNPFSNVVPKSNDQLQRLPLSEADMKAAKRNLDRLDAADQLLFRLLATTGMRLSEAFEIHSEATERGVRYVIVGNKTEQSKRRVPLPGAILPHLPKRIAGHLFGDDMRTNHRAASKRLNRFLNECGIIDPRKVIHSLRHRAQDRLRAASCPQDIREALLGHSEVTVGESYGEGFPVPLLKRWIDKIGG